LLKGLIKTKEKSFLNCIFDINKKRAMTNQPEKYQEFLLYKGPDGKVHFEVYLYNETLWLTQKKMAELFDINVPAISKHLQNIYTEGELQKEVTVSKMEIVQKEGSRSVTRIREFYNLDAIIAVGYRVNSKTCHSFSDLGYTGVKRVYY
jgi:hypothetical protein